MNVPRLVTGAVVAIAALGVLAYGMATGRRLFFIGGAILLVAGALIAVSKRFWGRLSKDTIEAGAEFEEGPRPDEGANVPPQQPRQGQAGRPPRSTGSDGG